MSQIALPLESDFMVDKKHERLTLPQSAANLQLGKHESIWSKVLAFIGLTITTTASSSLLYATRIHWVLPDILHQPITVNRAGTQLVIQILSSILGILQVIAVCQLIHFAARLHMKNNKVSLQWLQFYNSLSTKSINWSVGFVRIILLACFLLLAGLPAALWTGSLTPVRTSATSKAIIQLPQYDDISNIHYYAPDTAATVPVVKTWQGTFTYAIAMQYLGQLVSSAATATTHNGAQRRHAQYNAAQFTYVGRSYGVGSSVALTDRVILANTLLQSYSFFETGYRAEAHCSRNRTSKFKLVSKNSTMLFSAQGLLPNSPTNNSEDTTYFGQDMTAILAMGVAKEPVDQSRWMAIAAGDNYATFNTTQCRIDFTPTLFKITVDHSGPNITVTRKGNTTDIDPSGNLTQFVTYSLQQISTYATNPYSSSIADAFNSSILNYISTLNHQNKTSSTEKSIMAGISNSVEAMIDDLLVNTGSAQLMMAKNKQDTTVTVKTSAYRLGQNVFIYTIFGLNMVVVIAVLIEAIRTCFWKHLLQFSFQTPSHLIVATAARYAVMPEEVDQEDYTIKTSSPSKKRVLAALNVDLSSSNEATIKLSLSDSRKA